MSNQYIYRPNPQQITCIVWIQLHEAIHKYTNLTTITSLSDLTWATNWQEMSVHEVNCVIKMMGSRINDEGYACEETLSVDWADSSSFIHFRVLSKLEEVWWWWYPHFAQSFYVDFASCSPWSHKEIDYLTEILGPKKIAAIALTIFQEHHFTTCPIISGFLGLISGQVDWLYSLPVFLNAGYKVPIGNQARLAEWELEHVRHSIQSNNQSGIMADEVFYFGLNITLACLRSGAISNVMISTAIFTLVHLESNNYIPAKADKRPIYEMILEIGLSLLGYDLGILGERYLEIGSLRMYEVNERQRSIHENSEPNESYSQITNTNGVSMINTSNTHIIARKEIEAYLADTDEDAEAAYLLANFAPPEEHPWDALEFPEYCDWLT